MSDWKYINLERLRYEMPTDGYFRSYYIGDRHHEARYICSIEDVNFYTTPHGETLLYYGKTFDDLLHEKSEKAFLEYCPTEDYIVVMALEFSYPKNNKNFYRHQTFYKIECSIGKVLSELLYGKYVLDPEKRNINFGEKKTMIIS